ncbi:MAG: putative ubiquitin 2, partial [Streblomastix strix]
SPIEKIVELSINSADNVQSIKNRIQQNEGIPTDKQMLFFKGKKLDDQQKLQEFNIKNNDQFYLLAQDEEISQADDDNPSFNIIVKTFTYREKQVVVEMKSTDTVEELLRKIQERHEFFPGYGQEQLYMVFGGRRLEYHRTLEEYDIQNESIVQLNPFIGPGG